MSFMDKSVRILVADKQPIVIHALTDLLEEDSKVTIVGKTFVPNEVPELVTISSPHILITDLWFDDQLSGMASIETLRVRYPGLKVILFTAENSPDIVRQAHRTRLEGFVLKTDKLEEIKIAIQQVVNGHFYYSPRLISSLFTSTQSAGPSLDQLTPKEQSVLRQYARGMMPKEFASDLNIKPSTAETHLRNIKQTLGFRNTVELLRWAWQQGF
ncbi:LuxR C-terminal-related transcriptional regulator [Spirosoma validum]|uniref:Response regulator transcription factor n=1 Tax=Spirosoma validum TaxID=2771355 RepID=A0A927GCX2_9BACT|nr:response regulator transcription factor [Spirosoma validum]MBD2752951.1 response regulator transcription factor [Spirosoma validum]